MIISTKILSEDARYEFLAILEQNGTYSMPCLKVNDENWDNDEFLNELLNYLQLWKTGSLTSSEFDFLVDNLNKDDWGTVLEILTEAEKMKML